MFQTEDQLKKVLHDLNPDEKPGAFCCHTFMTRTSEADADQKVHTEVLFSLLQEIADFHSKQTGTTAKDLQKDHLAWILSRCSLQLLRTPGYQENITLYTWQQGYDRVGFTRNYLLFDEEGKPFGGAGAIWLLASLENHKLQSPYLLTDFIQSQVFLDIPALDRDPAKLRPNFADFSQAVSFSRHMGLSDIDINKHVNNTRYISMCRDAADMLGISGELTELEINYVQELFKGETASVLAAPYPVDQDPVTESKAAVVAKNKEGKDSFRALLTFRA